VAPSRHRIEVLPAIPGPKPEPVSPRLKATLVHADRESWMYGVRHSPDGRRIIAGGYPNGIIQVWDAETGRQLARFEAGYGHRGSAEYFSVSSDWKMVYAPTKGARKRTPFERDGKTLFRWEFDCEVRAWDLDTGDLLEVYRHDPPRNVRFMSLAPDGSLFFTGEQLPGETEGAPEQAVSVWDTRSRQRRSLPHGLGIIGKFSPDGRTLAINAESEDGYYTTAIKLFDALSMAEKLSIPIEHEFASAGIHGFTPDGAMLLGFVQVYSAHREWKNWDSFLKLWNAATGEELASFTTGEKNGSFDAPVFSPDGSLIAAVNRQGAPGRLHLFDVPARKRAETIVLTGKPGEGEELILWEPTFSPDGRWLAVVTQLIPARLGLREPQPEELHQARIHLVDVSARVVAETLLAPQGWVNCVCFSPDGKTLAAGGRGKVLIFDLTEPPGVARER
jgi:WD40 repeat protein